MRYRLPLLAEDVPHDQWVGWGAPPPGPQTAGTAVAFNKFGKGQSLYMGVPIFWAMHWRAYWIQKWIPGLIRQLVPNPLAELRTDPFSEYVHGTLFHDAGKQLILVQLLDTMQLATKGELRPTPEIEISIDPRPIESNGGAGRLAKDKGFADNGASRKNSYPVGKARSLYCALPEIGLKRRFRGTGQNTMLSA